MDQILNNILFDMKFEMYIKEHKEHAIRFSKWQNLVTKLVVP